MNLEKEVLFDPGIGELLQSFHQIAESAEYELSGIKSFHTKKARYQYWAPKLFQYFEDTIAFYNGCLMWGFYIRNFNQQPKEIANNIFLGRKEEDANSYNDVEFVIDYFKKFERNEKYYFNRNTTIDPDFEKIANAYLQFLKLNKCFTNTKMTSDIELPDEIIDYTEQKGQEALNCIENAIENKNLAKLLEFNILK